ncbi:MAG: hypothetical protein ACRD2C_02490 [Acidimicrobiales bacterium]
MRQDDGWRWLRNSSGIVAAVCGLIAAPVVAILAVVLVLVPFARNTFDYGRDPGPQDLGMSIDAQGLITARVPICLDGGAQVLQLVGPDQAVVWRAEAAEPVELETFVVSVAPEGFTDSVAFVGPLNPDATYDMQLLPSIPAESPTTTEISEGAHTQFRQVDLDPEEVFFSSRSVAPDEFDDAACVERGR